jgi:hypothetical protein
LPGSSASVGNSPIISRNCHDGIRHVLFQQQAELEILKAEILWLLCQRLFDQGQRALRPVLGHGLINGDAQQGRIIGAVGAQLGRLFGYAAALGCVVVGDGPLIVARKDQADDTGISGADPLRFGSGGLEIRPSTLAKQDGGDGDPRFEIVGL